VAIHSGCKEADIPEQVREQQRNVRTGVPSPTQILNILHDHASNLAELHRDLYRFSSDETRTDPGAGTAAAEAEPGAEAATEAEPGAETATDRAEPDTEGAAVWPLPLLIAEGFFDPAILTGGDENRLEQEERTE
jgi:hypothetical protein